MNVKWSWMRQSMNLPFSVQQEDGTDVKVQRETYSLLSLPAELLNILAQYLTVDDLLSCSLTCSRLRAVFNHNLIWRRFCKPNIINYLKVSEKKMYMKYKFGFTDCDLDRICEERQNYIQQIELLDNWRSGQFVEHKVHSASGLYYMSLKSSSAIIYKNIYLFLYDFFAHNIVIWDIENEPKPYSKISLLYHNYYYEELYYEIVGNKLIVLELGKLIQIYDINLPDKTLPLVCLIIVDDNEPLRKIPEFSRPEEMYSICYHKIYGNRIYSHKVGKPILHIWDVERQTKISALEPPYHGSIFDVLSATNEGNDLILCLEINDRQKQYNHLGRIYEVMSYSFSKDLFRMIWNNKLESSVPYVPYHAIQHDEIVILFCRLHQFYIEETNLAKTILVFYNHKYGVTIGERCFPELVCHHQTRVINNTIILATSFCVYTMELINYDIISSFKFDGGKIELLNIFYGNFIITTPKPLVPLSKIRRKEVWDLKNRRKCLVVTYAFTSPYSKDSVFVNESLTKMVVVGKGTLGILNFW